MVQKQLSILGKEWHFRHILQKRQVGKMSLKSNSDVPVKVSINFQLLFSFSFDFQSICIIQSVFASLVLIV